MKSDPCERKNDNMTEQEILRQQEVNGNQSFYLMLVGKFLHACGHGAFALAKTTGYRVMRKHRKWGEVLTCGFPMERFDFVCQRLRDAGGEMETLDDKTFMFRGIDGTPDLSMVCEPASKPEHQTFLSSTEGVLVSPDYRWLASAVRAYNLSMSTPMDAMLFIGILQQRLKETENKDDACESPAGQGWQE